MDNRNDGRIQRTISFYSDDLIALQELDANEIAVPVQRICANLGLDAAMQTRRIQGNPLLDHGLSNVPIDTERDGRQVQPCLRVDLVPLWLATISQYDVSAAMRPRLELYQ